MKRTAVLCILSLLIMSLIMFGGCGKKQPADVNATATDTATVSTTTDVVIATSDPTVEPTVEPTATPEPTTTVEPEVTPTTTETPTPTPSIPVNIQPSNATDSIIVVMKDFKFTPKEVTIRPGMTVTWVNDDTVETRYHKIQPRSRYPETPNWLSEQIRIGESYSYTFKEKGTFVYVDAVFIKTKGTEGTIIVK